MVRFPQVFNQFCFRAWLTRRRKITGVILVVLTVPCCFFWLRPLNFIQPKGSLTCPSQINYQNEEARRKLINVVSQDYLRTKTSRAGQIGAEHINEKLLARNECVGFKPKDNWQNLQICIYDPSRDLQISYHIKNHESWEKENVAEMLKAMKMFPEMILVDLGSNVGVFTLSAAAAGRETIAVDALLSNHQLLLRSLEINDLTCQVTLVHNALHSTRDQMRVIVNPSNIGGSVIGKIPDFRQEKISNSQRVDSVCLEDLTPLVRGKDVFLKMDIEGSEDEVLRCADNFFTEANVKVVLMEWINYRHDDRASGNIKSFLTSHHMFPTWGTNKDRTIDLDASHNWPDNVFWMKQE